jgi:hypothetical protein
VRVATVKPPEDAEHLRELLQKQLKATVLIQMDIELVAETEIPEAAGPPAFREAMVDQRRK